MKRSEQRCARSSSLYVSTTVLPERNLVEISRKQAVFSRNLKRSLAILSLLDMSTMWSTLQTANIEGILPCCCSHAHEISPTIYINVSRRKVLVAPIMEMQVMYVKARELSEVYVLTSEEPKGLGQRFEERRRGRPAAVFNITQKRPNTVVPLKVDEAMEGRRSHKEMRSR